MSITITNLQALQDALLEKNADGFFSALFTDCAPQVRDMAKRYEPQFGPCRDVDDVVSEVFFRLWNQGLKYIDPAQLDKIGGLVFRTTDFVIKDLIKRRTSKPASSSLEDVIDNPKNSGHCPELTLVELSDTCKQLLAALPKREAGVLWMFISGYNHAEIAAEFKITEVNSRAILKSARKKATAHAYSLGMIEEVLKKRSG